MALAVNPFHQSLLVDGHFLTWLLIGWRLCCQPIRSHIRKLLLANLRDFNRETCLSQIIEIPLKIWCPCMKSPGTLSTNELWWLCKSGRLPEFYHHQWRFKIVLNCVCICFWRPIVSLFAPVSPPPTEDTYLFKHASGNMYLALSRSFD